MKARTQASIFFIFMLSLLSSHALSENITILAWMPEHIPLLFQKTTNHNVSFILGQDRIKRVPRNHGIENTHLCYVEDINKDFKGMARCLQRFKTNWGEIHRLISGPSEEQILLSGKLRSKFEIPNGFNEEESLVFTDKYAMKQKLLSNQSSFKNAKFLKFPNSTYDEIVETLNFPLIIKPTISTASKGISVVHSKEELQPLLKSETQELVIEEFIEGQTLRVDGLMARGKLIHSIALNYEPSCLEYFNKGKVRHIVSDIHNPEMPLIKKISEDIANQLGLRDGVFHLEMIRHKSEFYFIELAARPGGGGTLSLFKKFFGVDHFSYFYDAQLGIDLTNEAPNPFTRDVGILSFSSSPYSLGAFQRVSHANISKIKSLSLPSLVDQTVSKLGKSIDLASRDGIALSLADFCFVGNRDEILADIQTVRTQILFQSSPSKPHVVALAWAPQDFELVDKSKFEISLIVDQVRLNRDKSGIYKKLAANRLCIVSDINNASEEILACGEKFANDFGQVDRVITFGMNEKQVYNTGMLREQLEVSSGVDLNETLVFVDKLLMKDRLVSSHIKIPTATHFQLTKNNVEQIASKLSYPIVIKPRREASARGVYIAKDRNDFVSVANARLEIDGENTWLAEEFVPGRIFRIDGFVYESKLITFAPGLYETTCLDYYQAGQPLITSSFLTDQENEKIGSFTNNVVKALKIPDGIFHLEAIFHDGNFYFLEVGIRPGGGSIEFLRDVYGFKQTELYIQTQLGEKIQHLPEQIDFSKQYYVHLDFPTLPLSQAAHQKIVSVEWPKDYAFKTVRIKNIRAGLNIDLSDFSGNVIPAADFVLVGEKEDVRKEAQILKDGTHIVIEKLN